MSIEPIDQPEQVLGISGGRLVRHGNVTNEEIAELGRQMSEGPAVDFSSLTRARNLIDPQEQAEATIAAAIAADKAAGRPAGRPAQEKK